MSQFVAAIHVRNLLHSLVVLWGDLADVAKGGAAVLLVDVLLLSKVIVVTFR